MLWLGHQFTAKRGDTSRHFSQVPWPSQLKGDSLNVAVTSSKSTKLKTFLEICFQKYLNVEI